MIRMFVSPAKVFPHTPVLFSPLQKNSLRSRQPGPERSPTLRVAFSALREQSPTRIDLAICRTNSRSIVALFGASSLINQSFRECI
jgi:hypothetical protein